MLENNEQEFLKKASKVLYEYKSEFANLTDQKLASVKLLKDLTGGGLKECKEALEAYWDGNLPYYLKEERREKLEKLAKLPLIDELILKIKDLDDDKLRKFLIEFTVYELLSIDEKFEKIK